MTALVVERPLALSEAARLPVFRHPDGSYPTPQTVARWARRGCCGIRLEARRIGREWVTSREACERFSTRLAAATMKGGAA